MKTEDQRICSRCGKPFDGHPTKRYCSATCRQYSYLERNGMNISTSLTGGPINEREDVKGINDRSELQAVIDSSKDQHQGIIKNNFNPNGNRGSETTRPIILDSLVPQAVNVTKADKAIVDINESQELSKDVHDNPERMKLLVSEPGAINDNANDIKKQFANEKKQEKTAEPAYKFIESSMIKELDEISSRQMYCLWFRYPDDKWNKYQQVFVNRVNEWFRCLLENMLLLTYKRSVNAATIKALSDTFEKIVKSFYYSGLPYDYPYKTVISSYKDRFRAIAANIDNIETIKFCLTQKTKAEIIIILWEIGFTVPKKRFSELSFE